MKNWIIKKIFTISSVVFLLGIHNSHPISFKLVNKYSKPIFYKIFYDQITPEFTLIKLNPNEEITTKGIEQTYKKISGLIISLDDPAYSNIFVATLYKFSPINYNINVYLDATAQLQPQKSNFWERLAGYYISERGITKKTIVIQKNHFGKLKFQERFPRPSLPHLPTFPKPPTFEEIPITQSKG